MRRQPPSTDAEWARNTENRMRRLESGSSTVRIGQWVLADRGGELVAVSADGRSYVLSSSATDGAGLLGTAETPISYTRVVVVSYGGFVTGGTFTLTFEGETTDPIDYDASAADIQSALGALPNYATGDFVVTGADGGPWTVAMPGVSLTGDATGLAWFPSPTHLFGVEIIVT